MARGGEIAPERVGAYARAIDAVAFWALIAGLAVAPFWFGGNRPIAWGLHAIWFGAISLLYEAGRLVGARRRPVALRRIWLPALCMGVVAVWAAVQMSPWTPLSLQHPIWQMAREALGKTFPGAVSVDVDETMIALVKLATGVCLFWTTLQLCRSPNRARRLVAAVAIIGAFYAAYGIIAFFLFPDTILWYPKFYYHDAVTSTFVNRNSYATYAGIGLVCALAIAFSHFVNADRGGGQAFARRLAGLVAATAGGGGAWLAASFVIGVALVLTASRGGIFATLAGILALAAIALSRQRKNAVGAGFGLLLALATVGVAAFAYGDHFSDRIATLGLASDDRLAVYHLSLLSIADAPLFGFGWGTFRQVFPMYLDTSLDPFRVWDLAHNTYIEIFQGLGIPVAVVFLLGIAILVGRCAYASLSRRLSATAPLVATAATFIVFLHAFVDFSLQMQAVTLTWTALLATGVAQSWSSRTATDQ
jgi:O-antigen ligase